MSVKGSKDVIPPDADSKKSGQGFNRSSENRKSLRENGFTQKPQPQARKPSRQKSFVVEELPPCQNYRTRSSHDNLVNPIDRPKTPRKYLPPFRRNFRYFGYPKDLNLDTSTPPRVKSWGSIPEKIPPSNKHKRRIAPSYGYRMTDSFDPLWMGRLLKRNLLLENPGLIPATDKAAISLGTKDKLKLIHPELEVHNCPSDLYFPITERSRKAFCRINKTVQDILDQQKHAYTVQNPTVMKFAATEQVMLKSERARNSKQMEFSKNAKRKSFQLGIVDENSSSEEQFFSDYYSKAAVSAVIKTMCVKDNYPGLNKQMYQRPKNDEDSNDLGVKTYDDVLRYGEPIIPNYDMNVPDDVWQKLAKVRSRQQQTNKNLAAKMEAQDPDRGKFRTFTQIELRNQVLGMARNNFMEALKKDLNAPLPGELFKDNRGMFQPYHDYYGKGELPAQGPFCWKTPREEPPTEEELTIVETYVEEAKLQHNFTHHLPGLVYATRHPFPPFELDWFEKGSTVKASQDRRKTPNDLFDMPNFIMNLDEIKFEEKLAATMKETAKELVGPEIYELYKRTYGIVDVKQKESTEEVAPVAPVEKIRRKVKRTGGRRKSQLAMGLVEEEDDAEEEEAEDDEEEDEEVKGEKGEEEQYEEESAQLEEIEPEYKFSVDLLEEEQFPLPDTRFSLIDFPKDHISEGLKEDMKYFKKIIENSTSVRSDEEEARGSGDSDGSSILTDSDEADKPPEFSHDAATHLQAMYQQAVKNKYLSSHRPIKNQDLEPPTLKDIFLMETYTEDIDNLLHHNGKIPKFLELF